MAKDIDPRKIKSGYTRLEEKAEIKSKAKIVLDEVKNSKHEKAKTAYVRVGNKIVVTTPKKAAKLRKKYAEGK